MPVREILHLGHPLLYEKSLPIDDPFAPESRSLIVDLEDTLADFRKTNGFGRGIAAPQIGHLRRVIFIRLPDPDFSGALINPVITQKTDRKVELWDNCFSFPELMVRVSRAAEIEVEYFSEQGDRLRLEAEGDLSELLQHEIDHLDGIPAVMRAISPQAFMTRQEWLRQGRPTG